MWNITFYSVICDNSTNKNINTEMQSENTKLLFCVHHKNVFLGPVKVNSINITHLRSCLCGKGSINSSVAPEEASSNLINSLQ